MEERARFASRTDEDIEKLLNEKESKSTKSATKQAVKIPREFCLEKGVSADFEGLSKLELNQLLKQFYANARKQDGSFYTKNTLNSIRYGLGRHLKKEKKFNIVEDPHFGECNQVFSASLVELKKNGYAKVNHHPEITKDDLVKLYSSFDLTTPRGLQQKCLFDIMFFLVRRGRENLREQTKTSFAIAVDSQNRRYVYQAVDELDKNHRENDSITDSITDGRMYEKPGPLCPVRSFELYLSKLHSELEFLWQRPKHIPSETESCESWYSRVPLGKNTIGNFMKELSKTVSLSKQYTNHSLRATALTVLDHCNFEARHIMRVSGHKSEASIRSYSRRLSENKQREISDALGLACGLPNEQQTHDARSEESHEVTVDPPDSPTFELSSSQFDFALDTVVSSPLPRFSLPGSPVVQQSSRNTVDNLYFGTGAFQNCNISFNFNSK